MKINILALSLLGMIEISFIYSEKIGNNIAIVTKKHQNKYQFITIFINWDE